jgi:hypothetical protein
MHGTTVLYLRGFREMYCFIVGMLELRGSFTELSLRKQSAWCGLSRVDNQAAMRAGVVEGQLTTA